MIILVITAVYAYLLFIIGMICENGSSFFDYVASGAFLIFNALFGAGSGIAVPLAKGMNVTLRASYANTVIIFASQSLDKLKRGIVTLRAGFIGSPTVFITGYAEAFVKS